MLSTGDRDRACGMCGQNTAEPVSAGQAGKQQLSPEPSGQVRILPGRPSYPQRRFGCAAHGVSAARVTARQSRRPVPREPWGRPACGPRLPRAGRRRASRPRSTHARAVRAAVQSRHHSSGTRSIGPRRRTRGRTCTRTSRSSRRSRWPRVGGCSSRTWVGARACSHYARQRSRTDRPGGSTRDRPDRVCHRTGEPWLARN